MKRDSIEILTDQKRLSSHLLIIAFSLITCLTVFLTRDPLRKDFMVVVFFLYLFIQIEVFLLLARLIFRRLETGKTRREITRTVLRRFALFYVVCLVAAFVIYLLSRVLVNLFEGQTLNHILNNFIHFEFRGWFNSTSAGLAFGAIIFVIIQWQDAMKREQQLREENLIFRNETLRNQVNPHFLFNSLNTLLSLIKTDPDTAEEFTGRLSVIYRYILENNVKETVPLKAELSFIEDYFYLYRIRDDNKIQLDISVDNAENFNILPVSLQVLVENAIKHNMATRENPLKISIRLEGHQVVVRNNLQKMASAILSTGTGLKNLSQRVSLISGKELAVEEAGGYFTVKLPLQP
jgi:two-component system LytT family sensor kinase